MNILALETAATACSVALCIDDQIQFLHKIAPMQQARLILPMITEVMQKAGLGMQDLDYIAYGCGPGSFTGIRIASSVAQGLAFAAGKSVVPVSSLAILAQTAWLDQGCREVLVAVDARMGQLYWGNYQLNQQKNMTLAGMEQRCVPEAISVSGSDKSCGVGDAWRSHGPALFSTLPFTPPFVYEDQVPRAEAMLTLAREKIDQGLTVPASSALPVYLK